MRLFALLACFASALAGQNSAPPPTQTAPADIASQMAAGSAAYLHGDYNASRGFYEQAWQLADQTPPDNPVRYEILRRLASVHGAAGEYQAAQSYLLLAINWRNEVLGSGDPKTADDLLQCMTYYRAMHLYNDAYRMLTVAMRIHAKNSGMDSTVMADDYSRMSLIDLDMKNLEAAAGALDSAIAIRTKLTGPLDGSLIYDLDRLGTVQITLRAYDKAEATYRRALVIRETVFGRESAELISTVDGLAYAYFGQKKYDEADPIYQRLLGLWSKSAGEEHPMMAAALDKVATFYLFQEKYAQAKDATARANTIRTKALGGGLSQEAAEEYGLNNWDAALVLFQRALKVMDPPNPMYADLRAQAEKDIKSLQELEKTPAKKSAGSKK